MKAYCNILLGTLFLFSSSQCKQKFDLSPTLPPATQSGADTFGCLVNGKVMIPQSYDRSAICFNCLPLLGASYGPNNFSIYADEETDMATYYDLRLQIQNIPVIKGQTILLKSDTVKNGGFAVYSILLGKEYKTTNAATGELYISAKDTVKKIISGTFKFTAVTVTKDTVQVTDGRFDVRYQ